MGIKEYPRPNEGKTRSACLPIKNNWACEETGNTDRVEESSASVGMKAGMTLAMGMVGWGITTICDGICIPRAKMNQTGHLETETLNAALLRKQPRKESHWPVALVSVGGRKDC